MAPLTLDQFPEELLERILAHALPSPRPQWLHSPAHPSTRLAPLLTSHQLTRIATPLLYHSVHLPTPDKACLLLRTLRAEPALAAHVRCLSIAGVWRDAAEVMSLCTEALYALDLNITFDSDDEDPARTDEMFAEALSRLTGVRHLTLRKPNNLYLSLPRARPFINAVALAIPSWKNLRTAHVAFKLSDDTPTSPVTSAPVAFAPFALPTITASRTPSTPGTGPVSQLSSALAAAPHLHTFTTHLPSVWNTSILSVSANPRLERIALLSPTCNPPLSSYSCLNHDTTQQAIVPTGLFLMEARRHQRLGELIKAGTPIIRTRAHTMGTPSPSPSPPPPPPPTTTSCVPSTSNTTAGGMGKRESGVGLGLRIEIDDTDVGTGLGEVAAACSSARVSGATGTGMGVRGKGKGKGRM
ncbi:hypothetical protein LshimejAT787_0901800 [Lyophyllum shimeji]|uniref:F-box domain-containing protein n=1 Tax=Lyophyllum shimeji TaxID=47721 RepID=A0A9P3PQS0_LYOSH|nr:hypothetical protein LshimejAT787_0901800 [Lyophyllum shimeji]